MNRKIKNKIRFNSKSYEIFICILIISFSIVFFSCQTPAVKKNDETPTRGNITIGVDESYKLLADAEIYTFEAIYKDAKINTVCAPEDSILKLFLDDSIRLMITGRKLTENEELVLKGNQIIARTTKIAYDALTFIINKKNPDSLIRFNTIEDIFKGNVSSWKEINPASKLGKIKVLFDNMQSANVNYIMKKFNITDSFPSYCSAAASNPEVISYVENHPEAIGVISVNWISDPQDSVSHSFLSKVKVVAVSSEYFSEGSDFYYPHPAYIADKSYPFIREVYAVSREYFSGLGSGFIAFVAGDSGQRIILKSGMVPAIMPIRLVQISNKMDL